MQILPTALPALASSAHPHRGGGWTPATQAAFITALSQTASVTAAAAHAGMSRQAAYWLRRQPAAADFRAAWDAALALAWTDIEATALERVLGGEVETLERDGVVVTRHRPCAPHLLVNLLDRALAARQRAEAAAQARIDQAERVNAQRELAHRIARNERRRGTVDAAEFAPLPIPDIGDIIAEPLRRLDDLTRGFIDRPGWNMVAGGSDTDARNSPNP